jgi:3-hydroxyisobutyrate dehydrogenase-like beta-hydroxyacid dehydrogenase
MTASRPRIGFIGAGMMGSGMVGCLLKSGYPVALLAHRNRARIEDLLARGATEAPDLQTLALDSDVVMICVNSADTVTDLVRAMSSSMREGHLIIDATTSKPETTRTLAAQLASRGIAFVDAPVVGGPAQAAAGELGTFLGGTDVAIARATPIVSTYSIDVHAFGPSGSGNTAKLLNNFLTVGLRQLVVHAFRAARRNGIDPAKLYALTAKGAAGSRTLEQLAGGAIAGDYTRNKFSIANCYKDITYAAPLMADDPDGRAIQEAIAAAYERLVAAGMGDRMASEMLDPAVEAVATHTKG